jgi:DNA-binding transcriptional regulator GbsR (MarR family)
MTKAKFETGTKKDLFERVISIVKASQDAHKNEIVDRLNHEIELISKKSAVNPAKVEADEKIKNAVLAVLGQGKPMTVSDIQNANPDLSLSAGISNSKVTSILTKLKNDNVVDRIRENGKSYYTMMS